LYWSRRPSCAYGDQGQTRACGWGRRRRMESPTPPYTYTPHLRTRIHYASLHVYTTPPYTHTLHVAYASLHVCSVYVYTTPPYTYSGLRHSPSRRPSQSSEELNQSIELVALCGRRVRVTLGDRRVRVTLGDRQALDHSTCGENANLPPLLPLPPLQLHLQRRRKAQKRDGHRRRPRSKQLRAAVLRRRPSMRAVTAWRP
jgi:hypothetical protein